MVAALLLAAWLFGLQFHAHAAPETSERALSHATASAADTAPGPDAADGPALASTEPRLVAAAYQGRGYEPTRSPSQRDSLAERFAAPRPEPRCEQIGSASLGVAVPSCLPLLRWSLAHSTATSPA